VSATAEKTGYVGSAVKRREDASLLTGRCLNGLDDVVVAGAAAEVPFEPVPDLLLGRVRDVLQQARGRHDHAGRAVAALQRMVLRECALHRMEPTGAEAFDRHHVPAVGLHGEDGAALDRLPVQVDGARAAGAGVAAHVRAREPELLP